MLSCSTIRIEPNAPIYSMGPYIPDTKRATAWKKVIKKPNSFWAA